MPAISEILAQDDFGRIVNDLCIDTIEDREPREYLEEYNGGRRRRSTSVGFREPKKIAVYSETEFDTDPETGERIPKRLEDKTVQVAKIITNIPKKIVRTAAAFLFGGDMTITADNTDDDSLEEFKKVFVRKLKMKSVLMSFARKVLSETKAAIVFYPVNKIVDGKKVPELKAKILSLPKNDNATYEFYPHFDDDDDMDAFIHKFTTRIDNSTYECVKIYTSDKIITAINKGGQWEIKPDKNLFGKIPVVYAEVDHPDWEDIVVLMDHYEMRLSRMSDTNDYFGDPMLKTYGVSNLPSKDTVGKELNFTMEIDSDTGTAYHGDAEYLAWQQSIDSQKEEISNERHEIFSGASCPDLSFDNLIGIGDLSGVSREFMTIDAKIKATEQMEIFGPSVQRCVAIVQAGMVNISHLKNAKAISNNYFEVTFGSILPKNLVEELQNLSIAGGGKPINSQETLTARSPYTQNVKEEVGKMKSEEQASAANNNPLGQIYQ
ncbi:phage portal protein [Bacteroides sp. AF16-49]|uniref:phage portal protein n=1 Tax=Bacteroides sp. AF16-49 TaxID=2292192 RepID=UPI000EFE6C4E|nr:phage portal protein [Bacteroides sp. AF16-49]RHR75552.1 phage portal protein [Bacteroides sp. AF16-49]